MANTNKVRLRHVTDGVEDILVSPNAAKVYLKQEGWSLVEGESSAGEASDDTAAPDADTTAAAPRGRGKGAAAAAEKEG